MTARRRGGGFQKLYSSMDIQRSVPEREGRWVLVEEPNQSLVVAPVFPPVSQRCERADIPGAFSQDVPPRLQGVFVASGTRGGFVWEKSGPVFTRRGVVREDMGDAAQVACIPFRHIVKKITGGLSE